jgi:hypothetical protein
MKAKLRTVTFEEALMLSATGVRVFAMNIPKEKTPTVKSFQRLTVKEAVGDEILLFVIEEA